MHEILRGTFLGNIKQQGFGFVDGFVDFDLFVITEGSDLSTGID